MDGSRARALLGVPAHATEEEVRHAFRRAARRAHPDAGGDASTFRSLVAARNVLATTLTSSPPGDELPIRIDVYDVPRRRPVPSVARPVAPDFDAVLARHLAA